MCTLWKDSPTELINTILHNVLLYIFYLIKKIHNDKNIDPGN